MDVNYGSWTRERMKGDELKDLTNTGGEGGREEKPYGITREWEGNEVYLTNSGEKGGKT